ncbi:transposase [Caballeronia mineralivorans PML1(12)]|uniref:Transposase n=1 Tax=Caballeronia mineralivorans PML1(12) TaxID=908627 RepID=A0A0J1FPV0_9BURK|nr:IS4 family transposase [Caballeronia mineralivorans]KLU21793.1 transposase [Caballeronia mineralivorans PML1(12)]
MTRRDRADDESWLDREIEGSEFQDVRLRKRFAMLLERLWKGMGQTIPLAYQDWANTKAAYRFMDNDRVSEHDILSGHFQATAQRFSTTDGPILVLQDTTTFSYERERPELVGYAGSAITSAERRGRTKPSPQCGILMHSSLAVTTEGLPLGLTAIKFWSRKEFKDTAKKRSKVNFTRIPIEKKESFRWIENLRQSTARLGDPERCVHIGDRESDIFELFCAASELGTHFLVRTCTNRLAGDGEHTVAGEMSEVRVKGLHRIEFRDAKGRPHQALLEIRYRRLTVWPPVAKQRHYPPLRLTVIHATEYGDSAERPRVQWKLVTDLPVNSRADAIEKIDWYALRWKIETFHKNLKSGCKAEESQLRTASRLTNLIAVFCILAWRVFWLTEINRSAPEASPEVALTATEVTLLDQLVKDTARSAQALPLSRSLIKLAQLGGYLARANDPPPGNKVIWRGMHRLIDIELGYRLGRESCG